MAQSKDPRSVRTVTAEDGTQWVARWLDAPGIDGSVWPGLRVSDKTVEFTGPDGRKLTGRVRYAGRTGDKALRSALGEALASAQPESPAQSDGGRWRR